MELESEVLTLVNKALEKIGLEPSKAIRLQKPPSPELGHFALMVNPIAKARDPEEIGQQLKDALLDFSLFDDASLAVSEGKKGKKQVYLNLFLNETVLKDARAELHTNILMHILSTDFGKWEDFKGKIAVVEHTSANPISPLHVGNLRNSLHGDTFANILESLGYEVSRRYYVNDVGLQIAFTVVGYEILFHKLDLRPDEKIDLWLGQIYAVMNCFYTIQDLKEWAKKEFPDVELSSDPYNLANEELSAIVSLIDKSIELIDSKIKDSSPSKREKNHKRTLEESRLKELFDKKSDLKKYFGVQHLLRTRFPSIFSPLHSYLIENEIDLKEQTRHYLSTYESSPDSPIANLFREMANWCLAGFQKTLSKFRVSFDAFDFESEITWSGIPKEIIARLAELRGFDTSKGLRGLRYTYPNDKISAMLKEIGRDKKTIPHRGNIPDLQLTRADGTALYPTKDIAYSIYKFQKAKADKVYNIVGAEQVLPQFQLLLPLWEMGYKDYAVNLHHYVYEIVSLKNRVMSGRLAQYVTADDFYKETLVRARIAKRENDRERGVDLAKEDLDLFNFIVEAITLSVIRFSLLESDPKRRIVLDIDQALDLRQSSGPFVQYALARTHGIFRKAKEQFRVSADSILSNEIDTSILTSEREAKLFELLNSVHDVLIRSYEEMNVSYVPKFAFELAQEFMKYYESTPILKGTSREEMIARLALVLAVQRVLTLLLKLMGIPAVSQM